MKDEVGSIVAYRTQIGTGALAESLPVFQMRYMVDRGPMALETSFDPCAKEAVAAVRTWRNEYRCSVLLS